MVELKTLNGGIIGASADTGLGARIARAARAMTCFTAEPPIRNDPDWAASAVPESGHQLTEAASDMVVIALGEHRWHGAAFGRVFTHVALHPATADGQQGDWEGAVSEADFARTDPRI